MLKWATVKTNEVAVCFVGIITVFALCFFMVLDLRLIVKAGRDD